MKSLVFRLLSIATLVLAFSQSALALDKTLKVGVSLGDPFVIETNHQFSGIAIDIWKQLAETLNLKYQFVPMGEHIDDAVEKLAKGQIDVLIGPIVPTDARVKLVDFLQPYYLNQIALVVPAQHISFLNAFGNIFSGTTLWFLLLLLFFFVIYLHIFWYYEIRGRVKAHKSYWSGIQESFWEHTLDIDLKELPNHIRTRQFRFIWLIVLTIFFSTVTASITSALTVALSSQYASYSSINDFKNKSVAAVVNTAPYDIAHSLGFTNLVPVNDRQKALDLLLNGQVDATVDYYPIADFYLSQHELKGKLTLANVILQRDTFAFAVPIDSPLRHLLNTKLRAMQDLGLTKVICKKYFMDDEKSVLNCEI